MLVSRYVYLINLNAVHYSICTFQMENNSLAEVLVLHSVTKADAGDYTCYIGNELTSLQLSATLTVIEEGRLFKSDKYMFVK